MFQPRPFKFLDLLLFLVVLAAAGGARGWYLCEFANCGDAEPSAVWRVQQVETSTNETDHLLIENIKQSGPQTGFRTFAPFHSGDEITAHVAPGYPVFRAYVESAAADYA